MSQHIMSIFFFWYRGLNSGPCPCEAGARMAELIPGPVTSTFNKDSLSTKEGSMRSHSSKNKAPQALASLSSEWWTVAPRWTFPTVGPRVYPHLVGQTGSVQCSVEHSFS